jgi:hypothetical protein
MRFGQHGNRYWADCTVPDCLEEIKITSASSSGPSFWKSSRNSPAEGWEVVGKNRIISHVLIVFLVAKSVPFLKIPIGQMNV